MKNLRTSLFLVALVCLFYLVTPYNAVAQSGGDIPCCFISPSDQNPFEGDVIQSMTIGNAEASTLYIRMDVPESFQSGGEPQIPIAEMQDQRPYLPTSIYRYYGEQT